jgi:general secretion pathway protein G
MNCCQAPRDGVRLELAPVELPFAARASVAAVRGFTLLELLVVLVIIGLLAGYVGPRFFAQIGKSEVKTAAAQLDALGKALDQYRLDTGHYPSVEQGLGALWVKPGDEARWWGPYLRKAPPKDPWGREYIYKAPGDHGDYDLSSQGKDGREGGEGEDQDITNW